MTQVELNATTLDYEVAGTGEPVLLIGTGPLADSFMPFLSQEGLLQRYQLITYRQRRFDSSHDTMPVSFSVHAEDAAMLLDHLKVRRAHIAGHSTGASIALQLALEHPAAVHTLILLEPPLPASPGAGEFFARVEPAVAAYRAGDSVSAMSQFLSVVCSLEWPKCRSVIEACTPGATEVAVRNAENFFESYLPAIAGWSFGAEDAASIQQPVLSVIGTGSEKFFLDGHELLRAWLPQFEECRIREAAHLLHMQQPEQVISGIQAFLARHPIPNP